MVYKLIHSKRKTLTIKITDDAEVIVLAPKKCDIKIINSFLEKKKNWIEEKILLQKKNIIQTTKYINLNEILLLGNTYQIIDMGKYYLINDNFIKHNKSSNKEKIIKDFLKKYANQYLTNRVAFLSKVNNFEYKSIKITTTRQSWGSCNSKKELKFTFRLIMLPSDLIDYVICHELCHTKELNHSKLFWNLLENLGYKKREIKLAFEKYRFVLNLF